MFTVFILILNMPLAFYSLGVNPVGLHVGIVNLEIFNPKECLNSSLLTVLSNGSDCTLNKVSCRFMANLDDELVTKIAYKTFEAAYDDAKRGKIMGIIMFPQNYTESLKETLVDNPNILAIASKNSSQISVNLDHTNPHLSMFLLKSLYETYKSYTESMLVDCKYPRKLRNIQLELEKPIYGSFDE